MAGNINVHPAPNRALGELMPGWYDVPQNPIMAAKYGIGYTPTLGEIMPGNFVVPQNPIADYASGSVLPLGVQPGAPGKLNGTLIGGAGAGASAGMGCGCGCGGGSTCACGGHGISGLGDVSTDLSTFFGDLTAGNWQNAFMVDTIFGIQAWILVAAVAAAGWYLLAGTGPSRATRAYRYTRRKAAAIAAA